MTTETGTTHALAPPTIATSEATNTTVPPISIDWTSCGEAECATLNVPLDHDDLSNGTIDLELTRLLAGAPERRIGALLFNPGGPGVRAIPLWPNAFSSDLLRHFDVVSWNVRGVSAGTEVVCVEDPAFFRDLDSSPDTQEETDALESRIETFVAGCREHSANLLPHLSTVSTARDMDLIRQALGEDQISFLGKSYGSVLGSVYATLFPERVRAMVLDGAFVPGSQTTHEAISLALEDVLMMALDDCAANRFCSFHHEGEPHSAFDDLVSRIDRSPIEANGRQVGMNGFFEALWWGLLEEGRWPSLMDALASAEQGDGAPLADWAGAEDQYFPNSGSTAIWCLDGPHQDVAAVRLAFDEISDQIPHLAPVLEPGPTICDSWPVEPDQSAPSTGAGAGPILVIGAIGDFATPLEASRQLADQLEDAALLVVDRVGHTSYRPGRFDTRCVTDVVDGYLIDLVLPADESVCVHGDPTLQPPTTP